ncbi:unnamed protein product [Urochloa humidicola]
MRTAASNSTFGREASGWDHGREASAVAASVGGVLKPQQQGEACLGEQIGWSWVSTAGCRRRRGSAHVAHDGTTVKSRRSKIKMRC